MIFIDDEFIDLEFRNDNGLVDIDDLTDDMRYEDSDRKNSDIMEVQRPVEYKTIFKRDKIEKLTIDEIKERLGYDIELIENSTNLIGKKAILKHSGKGALMGFCTRDIVTILDTDYKYGLYRIEIENEDGIKGYTNLDNLEIIKEDN